MKIILMCLVTSLLFAGILPIIHAENVPEWVKNTAGWWAADAISETEFLNAIVYLIKVGIIHVAAPNQENNSCEFEHIPVLNNLNQQQKIAICKSTQIDYLSERLDCSPCDADIKYNSNGFRGPEISKEKPDNTIRIFLVGGSTMANAEYADELFTTKGQMQQKIDELNLDVEVEIINAAIASAKSWHELQLAEEKLYNFNPDIIIHYTGWNDITAQVRDYEWVSVDKDQAAPEVWTQRAKEINANNWFENFRDACETREKMGIKTIVTLQPFVGTGKKVMTDQELDFFVEFGNGRNLELHPTYTQKVEELSKHCFAAANLSEIFDNFDEPIYRDGGHTLKKGMEKVADHLLYLTLPAISHDIDPNEILKPYKQNRNQVNLVGIHIDDALKYAGASLTNSDFSNQDLHNVNFFGSDLRNSDFSNSDVTNANFELSDLTGSNFEGAKVDQIKLKRAKLLDVNFSGVKFNSDLNHVDFRGSNLSDADLTEHDLKNTVLSNTNMKGANLTGAILSYEDIGRYNFLDNSDVRFTNFKNANLIGIDFTKIKNKSLAGVDLSYASLSHADLTDVDMSESILFHSNFWNADLSDQDFTVITNQITGSMFIDANLSNSNFEGVKLSPVEFFTDTFKNKAAQINLGAKDLVKNLIDPIGHTQIFLLSEEVIGNDLVLSYVYFNNFKNANLENANFKNSELWYANFYSANLTNAELSGADLRNTYLGYADLSNANLSGANLEGAVLDNAILTNANLSGANLNCVGHEICTVN